MQSQLRDWSKGIGVSAYRTQVCLAERTVWRSALAPERACDLEWELVPFRAQPGGGDDAVWEEAKAVLRDQTRGEAGQDQAFQHFCQLFDIRDMALEKGFEVEVAAFDVGVRSIFWPELFVY
jgi:hypothetical protein